MSYSRIKFMLLSIFKMKLKRIALGSVIITNLLSSICTSILIMNLLNCCHFFWWFYCVDIKDTIFICCFFVFVFFFSLCELFPAFICANNTGSLVKSLFGVEVFNLFLFFTFSSPSSSGMCSILTNTSLLSSSVSSNFFYISIYIIYILVFIVLSANSS